MSVIPGRTGPSTTTKNLHLAILSFCVNLNIHTSNCLIFDYMYVLVLLFLWNAGPLLLT